MAELVKPFPGDPKTLHQELASQYLNIADIQGENARIMCVSVGGHYRDPDHPQYSVLGRITHGFIDWPGPKRAFYEGPPRPEVETTGIDAIRYHAEAGFLIALTRGKVPSESWDLTTGQVLTNLIHLYSGGLLESDPEYQLPARVWREWPDTDTFVESLLAYTLVRHRGQYLSVLRSGVNPGSLITYHQERMAAHGVAGMYDEFGIDIEDTDAAMAMHVAACEAKKPALSFDPAEASEGVTPDDYVHLYLAPPGWSADSPDSTPVELLCNLVDQDMRNRQLGNLISELLREGQDALMIAGGWHFYEALKYLRECHVQVERMSWYVGMAACQEAFGLGN